jgi:hypothetical protein
VTSPLRKLLATLRRWFGRRRARRLVAGQLPRAAQAIAGLLAGPKPSLPLALRTPGPLEPQHGSVDYCALLLGSQAIRRPGSQPARLLRLTILPPQQPRPDAPRPAAFRLDASYRPSAQACSLSAALARPLRSQALSTLDALERRPAPGLALHVAGVVSARAFGLDRQFSPRPLRAAAMLERRPLPERWGLPPPRLPLLRDLGAARPAALQLDAQGTLPVERELVRLSVSPDGLAPPRAPLPSRRPAVSPLLARLQLRHFRIDEASGQLANEDLLPPRPQPDACSWLTPEFDRDFCLPRWMVRPRVDHLSATPLELFIWWWLGARALRLGPGEPLEQKQDEQISYMVWNDVKEQMLIRRDVARDETGPQIGDFSSDESGPQIAAHGTLKDLSVLLPRKQWIERLEISTGPVFEETRPVFDAYVQWCALVQGLAER